PSSLLLRFFSSFSMRQPFPVPREMTVEEIKTCVEQFCQGALNSIEAGFDGVEVRVCWG
ncbi:unnamed protein product, partial [Hapterophycus canaliculatus]